MSRPDGHSDPGAAPADLQRWRDTLTQTRARLLAQRTAATHWEGHLASSALSTATAVSALALVDRAGRNTAADHVARIAAGMDWLDQHRNPDGGWGDTIDSPSNISTTALAAATFAIVGRAIPSQTQDYLRPFGPLEEAILRAYGQDRTFSAPILMHCALAGLVGWRRVPQLPFELSVLPQGLYRFLGLPVVSYALPALIAIGLARFVMDMHGSPLSVIRQHAIEGSLRRLSAIQPESGGFLEAAPLTAFVTMGLAAAGRSDHPVAGKAVEFLLAGQREDGAWPIDTNLSVWNTTMAVHALGGSELAPADAQALAEWLLQCQVRVRHPYTGSPPGGWGWSHLSGSVPDADDTAGALLALAELPLGERSARSAEAGIHWLLGLQNRDGGWPTFCRGWGKLDFDRSGCDLTAHVLRAMHRWRTQVPTSLAGRIAKASRRGLAFLAARQRSDGAWLPLWFGSQRTADLTNPVFGTGRVLLAYRELGLWESPPARAGRAFLVNSACPTGGWGADLAAEPSIEETAVALEALAEPAGEPEVLAVRTGADWLCQQAAQGGLDRPTPIGLYFARLWYHEKLYPITMTTSALRCVLRAAELVRSAPPHRGNAESSV